MHHTLVDRTSKIGRAQSGADSRQYALGHSEDELKRLELQGAFVRELTEDGLRRAGLTRGMRVLDLGCGAGDVSLVAGELVGPSGLVLGVDRSPEAVATAERRAVETGQCHWVRFAVAELDAFAPDETFDAMIGRLVLAYLPDPAATLQRLSAHLRPGGIVAFIEAVMPLVRSVPDGPQVQRVISWILDTMKLTGTELDMGGKLFETFLAAGFPPPQMVAGARVEGGPNSRVYEYMAETLRSLLPAAERLGVTSAVEVEIDTLAERLRREALARNACIMLPPYVGAWTRTPA